MFTFKCKEKIPHATRRYGEYYYGSLAGNMEHLETKTMYHVDMRAEFNDKYRRYQYVPMSEPDPLPLSDAEQLFTLVDSVIEDKIRTEYIIKNHPNIVSEIINDDDFHIDGLDDNTNYSLCNVVRKMGIIHNAASKLRKYGVKFSMVSKMVKQKPGCTDIVNRFLLNPYILMIYGGVKFDDTDKIALRVDHKFIHSVERLNAFLFKFLSTNANANGDTRIPVNRAYAAVKGNIPEVLDIFEKSVYNEHDGQKETIFHVEDNYIGLLGTYLKEKIIFNALVKRSNSNIVYPVSETDEKTGFEEAAEILGFELTDEQKTIVHQVLKNNVSVLCGAAGTGKTSTLTAVITSLSKYDIACAALSAKAAQRIKESTGHDASTIHRMLGWNHLGPYYNKENPLPYDVVILDECSMIDVSIFFYVLIALKPGCRLILCGDNHQLPPVGVGNIFNDILNKTDDGKPVFNVIKLLKVLRQAQDSGILMDATTIRRGYNPVKDPNQPKIVSGNKKDMFYMFRDNKETLQDIAVRTYIKSAQTDGLDDVVIITPRKQNCVNCTRELNRIIQSRINPVHDGEPFLKSMDRMFHKGDKVIQRANNSDKNVFNGEIGYVEEVVEHGKKSNTMLVKFASDVDDDKVIEYNVEEAAFVDFAYALTTHLSQGSGYKTVIAIIDTSHTFMLDRCMLYTMITRAKKRCLLLSEKESFLRCIRTNKTTSRQTWFGSFLLGGDEKCEIPKNESEENLQMLNC